MVLVVMSESSSRQAVTIGTPDGLHLRPADAFVKLAKQFQSAIRLAKDGEAVDAPGENAPSGPGPS